MAPRLGLLDRFLSIAEVRSRNVKSREDGVLFRSLKVRHWNMSVRERRGALCRISTEAQWAIPIEIMGGVVVALVNRSDSSVLLFDPCRIADTTLRARILWLIHDHSMLKS
ncbi:uncharacterized protein LOC120353030 [Nilaparvata lugens]|uniref:uncharacterized protein LOC120350860 n=1 Tax=Nilaparvata lugens TaxID=108931 RepID=UPI00193DAADB|nr:uncharacterized protein LOC120350860 [Nilaparvata lugens]XP_039291404.1 uncharacterized protein LOC120353030 [Nilaparvata lugens]